MEGDTGEDLARVLSLCRVPEVLSTRVTTAYETPSDFAFAFPRLESLDTVFKDLDDTTIQALNLPAGMELLSSLPAARLRKALKLCQDATIHAPAESLAPKTPDTSPEP